MSEIENGLTQYDLREIELSVVAGKPVSPELVQQMAEVLSDLLDLANDVDFDDWPSRAGVHDVDGIAGVLKEAAEGWKASRDEREEEREEFEKKLEEQKTEAEKEKSELAASAEQWQARANELEAELDARRWENRSNGSVRITQLEEDLVALRAQVFLLESELERSREQANRAMFWSNNREKELKSDADRRVAAETTKLRSVEARVRDLREALRRVAAADPKDAHRLARVAFGGDLLDETGTRAREGYRVPLRSEKRRSR